MVDKRYNYSKIKNLTYSVFVAIFTFAFCFFVIFIMMDSIKQREILDTTDRFMAFESDVERLMYSNIDLLKGYDAYLKTNENMGEQKTYEYLDSLLADNMNYIRNVGIIKDTTIIWNYPKETNSKAIGTDLVLIKDQRDLILKVKEQLVPALEGPTKLVQGGEGFIVRLPIVMKDTGYWGQVSIVLKKDEILQKIDQLAEDAGINVALYNKKDIEAPFFKSYNKITGDTLSFTIDEKFIDWEAKVSPISGWQSRFAIFVFAFLFAGLLSLAVGIIFFNYIKSKYQLINLSMRDSLSGLYNRHFLEEYQRNILEGSKVDGYKVGFLSLDLNDFKEINDTYGHGVGDLVIVETARILKAITRVNKAVFRLGGDEFLVMIPDLNDKNEAEIIKKKLIRTFMEDFNIENYNIKMVPSIGISVSPEDGMDFDTLLHVADDQMYAEKEILKKMKNIDQI